MKKLLLTAFLVFIPCVSWSQQMVYDAARHMEDIKENLRQKLHDVEDLLNQAEQIANQVTQIQHQAEMIAHMATDLTQLDFSSLGSIQAAMGKLEGVVNSAEGLGYQLYTLSSEFNKLYPQFDGSVMTAKDYSGQYQAWLNQTREGVKNAMAAQGLVMTNADHQAVLTSLVNESQSSKGTLQAIQAANQISAIMVTQLNELKTISAANGQAVSSYIAGQTAAENQGKAWSEKFFSPVKVNDKNDSPGLYPLK